MNEFNMNEGPVYSVLTSKSSCNGGFYGRIEICKMTASGFTGDFSPFNGTYTKNSGETQWLQSGNNNIYFTFTLNPVPRWIGVNSNIITNPKYDVNITCPGGNLCGNNNTCSLPINGTWYKKLDLNESPPAPSAGDATFTFQPPSEGEYIWDPDFQFDFYPCQEEGKLRVCNCTPPNRPPSFSGEYVPTTCESQCV